MSNHSTRGQTDVETVSSLESEITSRPSRSDIARNIELVLTSLETYVQALESIIEHDLATARPTVPQRFNGRPGPLILIPTSQSGPNVITMGQMASSVTQTSRTAILDGITDLRTKLLLGRHLTDGLDRKVSLSPHVETLNRLLSQLGEEDPRFAELSEQSVNLRNRCRAALRNAKGNVWEYLDQVERSTLQAERVLLGTSSESHADIGLAKAKGEADFENLMAIEREQWENEAFEPSI